MPAGKIIIIIITHVKAVPRNKDIIQLIRYTPTLLLNCCVRRFNTQCSFDKSLNPRFYSPVPIVKDGSPNNRLITSFGRHRRTYIIHPPSLTHSLTLDVQYRVVKMMSINLLCSYPPGLTINFLLDRPSVFLSCVLYVYLPLWAVPHYIITLVLLPALLNGSDGCCGQK